MVCSAQITYTFCLHLGWYLNQNLYNSGVNDQNIGSAGVGIESESESESFIKIVLESESESES